MRRCKQQGTLDKEKLNSLLLYLLQDCCYLQALAVIHCFFRCQKLLSLPVCGAHREGRDKPILIHSICMGICNEIITIANLESKNTVKRSQHRRHLPNSE